MRLLATAALVLVACAGEAGEDTAGPGPRTVAAAATGEPERGLLRDVTAGSGLDFTHDNGATGRKYLPEIMGAGGAVLDYDGDGRLDLYLVQSGPLPWEERSTAPTNRLFRNLGGGVFTDVTAAAGAGDGSYGMGAVAGDYDNDGDTDLYLVNLGPDRLLANHGDGTFVDATATAHVDSPLWGSSASFVDGDRDGDLDLYVVNYLDFSREKHIDCGSPSKGLLAYCHPDAYEMAPDLFLENTGGGTFRPATDDAGLTDPSGKGLGVVAADLTGDGAGDIYVANDSTPNFLYRTRGTGRFAEAAIFLGVGHNDQGKTEAGMGAATGDVDGDGRLDLFVTNLNGETNSLYLGGDDLFTYGTREAGLYAPSFMWVGFGTELVDLDNDGDLDLVVTNGHVIDNVELIDDAQSFRQPSQVFLNDGSGGFSELPVARIPDLAIPRVGRGTMSFDLDDDGGRDLAVTFNADRARLFRNEFEPRGTWLGVGLTGADCNRDGVGARLVVEAAGRRQIGERIAGSSYQTSGDPRVHFGLAAAGAAERVEVRWPCGRRRVYLDLPADRYYRLVE